LYATSDELTFTAPNFHYLMDSPIEFSDHIVQTFSVPDPGSATLSPTFRVALHHDGTPADAGVFAKDIERIVREAVAVFGEFPRFENGTYTFLSDYLPWASGDGMEHRNSTVLSGPGALRNPGQRTGMLGTVAHEFFHAWNMERIRSRDLEPFNFEEADVSGELWLGEGFTSYYDDLIIRRAGLAPLEQTLNSFAGIIDAVTASPARKFRSAEEMSRLAPFVDAAAAIDRTSWENTFISYYTFGAALGLALDLSLRDRSDGRTTLDTYMRALWARHGRPGQKTPGMVATPYTTDDLKAVLAEVSGDPQFAQTFFARYIQGHDVADYGPLLARAGLTLKKRNPGAAFFTGSQHLTFEGAGSARVTAQVPFDSWMYKAGIERDDLILSIDDVKLTTAAALDELLGRHKPGDQVRIRFVRRGGETLNGILVLEEDPRFELIPVEQSGDTLTAAQKQFREQWLGSRQ
jgi:predicted metalloprotease with PDZ domain